MKILTITRLFSFFNDMEYSSNLCIPVAASLLICGFHNLHSNYFRWVTLNVSYGLNISTWWGIIRPGYKNVFGFCNHPIHVWFWSTAVTVVICLTSSLVSQPQVRSMNHFSVFWWIVCVVYRYSQLPVKHSRGINVTKSITRFPFYISSTKSSF